MVSIVQPKSKFGLKLGFLRLKLIADIEVMFIVHVHIT